MLFRSESVYRVGVIDEPERSEVEHSVAALHSDPGAIQLCHGISAAAQQYLQEIIDPQQGRGYVAREAIPANTGIGYYTGKLELARIVQWSNHVMHILYHFPKGKELIIDGTPPPGERLPLGSMQLVNHSCSPNCTTHSYDQDDGLSIHFLRTSRIIQPGEQITFAYGGTFWQQGGGPCPGQVSEFRKVPCRCAQPACPNGLARWERVERGGTLRAREASRGRSQRNERNRQAESATRNRDSATNSPLSRRPTNGRSQATLQSLWQVTPAEIGRAHV